MMNYTCPKCGKKIAVSTEELINCQYQIVCPECQSELQIVGDYAYIPSDTLELDANVEPTRSINCPKCGHEASNNVHFCPKCGASFDTPVPGAITPESGVTTGELTPQSPPPFHGDDPLYNEVVEFLKECTAITPMMLRDRFHITDERAAELIRQLEANGIIGPYNNGGPRQILIPHRELMTRNPRMATNPSDPTAQGPQQGMPRRGGIGCVMWFVILMFIIMAARACAGG